MAFFNPFMDGKASKIMAQFRELVAQKGTGNSSELFQNELSQSALATNEELHSLASAGIGEHIFKVTMDKLARACPKECAGCGNLNLTLTERAKEPMYATVLTVSARCESRFEPMCPARASALAGTPMWPAPISKGLDALGEWGFKEPAHATAPAADDKWQTVEIGLEFDGQGPLPEPKPQRNTPATPTELVW